LAFSFFSSTKGGGITWIEVDGVAGLLLPFSFLGRLDGGLAMTGSIDLLMPADITGCVLNGSIGVNASMPRVGKIWFFLVVVENKSLLLLLAIENVLKIKKCFFIKIKVKNVIVKMVFNFACL
jgi:hypothetical protein